MLLSILLFLTLSGGLRAPLPVPAPPTAAALDLEEWKRALRSDDEKERQRAVSGLAEAGTDEAWALVIGALADRSPRVADEAQLRLGAAPATLIPELLGKDALRSRRGITTLRVAELLGRLSDPGEAEAWAPLLGHKDEAVRRSLLWSVERQAAAGNFDEHDESLLAALERLADRDEVPAARAHAVLALAALSPARGLARGDELSGAREPELRAAAVEMITLLPVGERVASATRAAEDDSPLVRRRAHEQLAGARDRDGARALADRLGSEKDLRLSWQLTELLQDLSGLRYGRDPRAWKRWADSLADGWTSPEEADERDYGEQTVAFAGLPILSEHVSFLIDFSGSMWHVRDGKTRKEVVDGEMRRALEGLPETTEFNVHPFIDTPLRWQKKLVPAKRRNVQRALEYFEDCKARGKGNFWDAALDAMGDPAVDTLMVLTDGAPTGGTRWNMRLMKELFTHENRFRGVALDVLLVDSTKNLQRHWAEMSARAGGRCLPVDL